MVAHLAIDRASARIDAESAFESPLFDAFVQSQARVEGLFSLAVLNQLEGQEQPATADVADVRVLTKPLP